MVALVADVGMKATGGVRVSFFGRGDLLPRRARPYRPPERRAARVWVRRAQSPGTYDIVLGTPIFSSHTLDAISDMEAITQQVADQLEALIRRFPDQWYMFRDMWPLKDLPPRLQPALADGGDATPAAS